MEDRTDELEELEDGPQEAEEGDPGPEAPEGFRRGSWAGHPAFLCRNCGTAALVSRGLPIVHKCAPKEG